MKEVDDTREDLESVKHTLGILNIAIERAFGDAQGLKELRSRVRMRKAFESAGLLDIMTKLTMLVGYLHQ